MIFYSIRFYRNSQQFASMYFFSTNAFLVGTDILNVSRRSRKTRIFYPVVSLFENTSIANSFYIESKNLRAILSMHQFYFRLPSYKVKNKKKNRLILLFVESFFLSNELSMLAVYKLHNFYTSNNFQFTHSQWPTHFKTWLNIRACREAATVEYKTEKQYKIIA